METADQEDRWGNVRACELECACKMTVGFLQHTCLCIAVKDSWKKAISIDCITGRSHGIH